MIVLRLRPPASPATGPTTPASVASSTASPASPPSSATGARPSWSHPRPSTWTASPAPPVGSPPSPPSTTAPDRTGPGHRALPERERVDRARRRVREPAARRATTTVRQPRPTPARLLASMPAPTGAGLASRSTTTTHGGGTHRPCWDGRLAAPRQGRAPGRASPAGRPRTTSSTTPPSTAWATSVTADAAFHALQQAGVAAAPWHRGRHHAHRRIRGSAARQWIRPPHQPRRRHLQPPRACFPRHPHGMGAPGAPASRSGDEYVFKEIVGLDDDKYDRLVTEHVATNDYFDRDGNPY